MNRKILYLLCAIGLFVTVYEITKSYGLFESNNNLIVESSVGEWNIMVNGTNIKTSETFTVNSINIVDSDNVLNGKLAPGSRGYFDIVIDRTDSSTSIKYDVTFDFSNLSDSFVVDDIVLTSGGTLHRTGKYTYTGVIGLNDQSSNTIRTYIKWENNEDNNEEDSAIGKVANNKINIPITIDVIQYNDETITDYVEENEEGE